MPVTAKRLLVLTADTGPGGTARWLQTAVPELALRYSVACVYRTRPPYLMDALPPRHPPVTYAALLSPGRLFGAWAILNTLRTFRPDVILVSGYVSLLALCIIRRLRLHPFVPILLVQRGVYRDFPNIAPWKNSVGLQGAWLTLEKRDRIVAVSPNVAEYLATTRLRRFPAEIIANGIAPHRIVDERERVPDALHFVFVGRLSAEKGADRLPEVARALPPEAVLHIAGSGSLEGALRTELSHEAASGRVVFHGWVDEPVELLRGAAALLVLSRTEGCPHAVLEAFGTRTLVMSLRVGGMPYVLDEGRCGLLFDSPEDLVTAVRQSTAETLGRQTSRIERASVLLAERYSHDVMMRRYCEALESLLV